MKGRFWRKALAAALALLVVSGNVPLTPVADLFGDMAITVSAATLASGGCGPYAGWSLDSEGKLTISGTGKMTDYGTSDPPWQEYISDITSIEIEYGITTIGESAFANCKALTSITFPDSLTGIYPAAFYNCKALTSITFPSSVTDIFRNSFFGCTSVTDVYCYTDPNNMNWQEVDCNDFMANKKTVCHVPLEHYDGYVTKFRDEGRTPLNVTFKAIAPTGKCGENATWKLVPETGKLNISGTGAVDNFTVNNAPWADYNPWADYKEYITSVEIGNGITSIGTNAFAGCTNLTGVTYDGSALQWADITGIADSGIPAGCTMTYLKKDVVTDDNITNGSVTPDKKVCSPEEKVTLTVTPDVGFSIQRVTVNGTALTPDENGTYSFNMPDEDVTVSAVFEINKYTVIWQNYDGTVLETDENVPYGTMPSYDGDTPVKPADNVIIYEFTGWDHAPAPVDDNKVFKAVFDSPNSGKCGEKAYWAAYDTDDDGTFDKLVISGEGAMEDHYSNDYPWYKYRESIKTIEIGNNITYIGSAAFGYCNVETVIFDEGSQIQKIVDNTFVNCSKLEEITIPANVTSIGINAFYECTSLTKVGFEEDSKLETINSSAFHSCSKLEEITIPANVTSIGNGAFGYCTSLANVCFEEGSKLETIDSAAFVNCSQIEEITIPANVTSIGSGAFYDCTSLTKVGFEEGSKLEIIDNTAFANCSKLEEITIPASLKTFGSNVFYSCGSLSTVNFEPGCQLTEIPSSFFYGLPLKEITIPANVTSIGSDAFYECTSLTKVGFEGGSKLETINSTAFANCSKLEEITIPASLKTFGSDVFYGCGSLSTVNFEPGCQLTEIPYSFFDDLPLKEITIPANVTSIGSDAFYECTSLTKVGFEEGSKMEIIDSFAFEYCSKLEEITIPANVTSIGSSAFYGCTDLNNLTYGGSALQWVECTGGYDVGIPESCTMIYLKKDVVIADNITNGSVTPDKTVCSPDEKVTLTVTPNEGYAVKSVSVNGTALTPDENSTYSFTMPDEDVTVSAEFDTSIGEHLAGYSLSLDGDIGVNFYMELSDEVTAPDSGAYMQFTLPNGDTPKMMVSEAKKVTDDTTGKTYYVFKCNVAAKEMNARIKAQIIFGDKRSEEYTYTVREYADYLLEHTKGNAEYTKAAPLVKAMLNYGAASQTYFGIEGTAANASLTDEEKALGEVSIPNTFKFDDKNSVLPEGVTFEGATLSLRSETTLSLYFKGLADGTKFICNGKTVETAKNGEYVVARIRGIKANELENNFTVKFGESSVTYNAMTYCYNVLNSDTEDAALKKVCCALYLYAQAAIEYSE